MFSFSTFLLKTSADFVFDKPDNTDTEIVDVSEITDIDTEITAEPYDTNLNITIYNYQEKRYEEISLRDYLICAVAGEMPVTFESEALKAQAIAARTYVMARHSVYSNANCKTYTKASVCTNSACCQAYKSIDKMVSSWGESYDEYYKIKNLELFISSGIGTNNIGIRFFCFPSINFFRLSKN